MGNEPDNGGKFEFRIKPINTGGLEREFVNFAGISHTPNEFSVEFCDANPPSEDERASIKETGVYEVPMKFRMVCTPAFIKQLIIALDENIKMYEKKRENDEKRYADI